MQCGSKVESLPSGGMEIKNPYQEFSNSTMLLYSGKYLQWTLESKTMRKSLNDTARVLASPVILSVFDTAGHRTVHLLSDSGYSDNGMNVFTVWGDVYVRARSDSLTIRSEKLIWNKLAHHVTSDTHVQITTITGDVLRGVGLDADEDFSHWKLLKGVSGKFPNFKERVDKGEGF